MLDFSLSFFGQSLLLETSKFSCTSDQQVQFLEAKDAFLISGNAFGSFKIDFTPARVYFFKVSSLAKGILFAQF